VGRFHRSPRASPSASGHAAGGEEWE
jgi:hypothetical protein